jgi:hypothetical protein
MELEEYRSKSTEEVRERVMDLLATYYARGALELEEYERRVEEATRVQSRGELEALVSVLPALPPPAGSGSQAPAAGAAASEDPAPRLAEGQVRESQTFASVFSSVWKRGEWYPARHTQAVAFFGSTSLDLRQARIPPGVSVITAAAIFGSVSILVPPGVNVEMNGIGVFGSFDSNVPEERREGWPTIRVEGAAFFGSASVRVKRAPTA